MDKKQRRIQQLWVELEWRRCAADEQYFIDTYVWVPSEEDPRGRTRFHLFDYQEELLNLTKSQRFVVALKARQIGFTTLAMAHALWLALFKPGATILVVSRTQDSSNKNLAQARMAYRFLPAWMQDRGPRLDNDSTKGMSFVFEDGMVSYMKAASATASVFAGETASLVIWDEAGLVEPATLQDDVLRTLLPTTEAGGSFWVISTARGAYNRFAKTYRNAKRGNSQFVPFFKPWTVSPFMRCSKNCGWCGGDEGIATPCYTKYDGKRREFADQPWRFYMEYPSDDEEAFRESGRPRFVGLPSEEELEELPYRGDIVWVDDKTLKFEHDEDGPLRLATLEPDPKGFYVIGADPSQGVGRDFATAHVMTLDEGGRPDILGYYRSNTVQPPEFAAAMDRLGRFFSGRDWAALLAVEDQGGQGQLPINELHRHLEYPNPYMHQQVGTRRTKAGRVFAFPMTMDRRRAVIDRLAKYLAVQDGECMMNGLYPELRVELGQFVAQELLSGNIRYAADVGCHDDLVMSLAITTWVLIEEYEKGSPSAAMVEELVWGRPQTLNLSKYYEARDEHIAELEAQTGLMSLSSNAEQLQIPRGYSGSI
tara:strand:+ start:1246 stop:3030 length:1785 start_codon:yes stop_codon:yes gene_type:complete